jgi:hypothetical protein
VVAQEAEKQAARVTDPARLLAEITPSPVAATYVLATDTLPTVDVVLPRIDGGDFALRCIASLAVLLGAVIVWISKREMVLGDYLRSCPQVVGVLAGLAWWLWLTPSVLGWVIVALSLIAGIRPLPVAGSEDKTKRIRSASLPFINLPRQT